MPGVPSSSRRSRAPTSGETWRSCSTAWAGGAPHVATPGRLPGGVPDRETPGRGIAGGLRPPGFRVPRLEPATFLSGLILFQFGTGPVRGFAVTLCLGILTSLATGVFGTRVVYDFLTSRRRLATVSV